MFYVLLSIVNYINTFEVLEARLLKGGEKGTNSPFGLKGGGGYMRWGRGESHAPPPPDRPVAMS